MDTAAQEQAATVLVNHRAVAPGCCSCGWGLSPLHSGQSHPGHVLDQLEHAGLKVVDAQ